VGTQTERPPRLNRRRRLVAQLVALGCVVALGHFAAEPMRVSSTSMVPTFRSGDEVLVDKLAYREDQPRRGDLVVFDRSPDRLLKRVVAIPGDEVGIEDGVLVVNGRPVEEPAVDRRQVDGSYFGPAQVPAGTVFVLGDNRANSVDSRTIGPVPVTDLVGRIVLRLWPGPGAP
jgi:signal peptidase I